MSDWDIGEDSPIWEPIKTSNVRESSITSELMGSISFPPPQIVQRKDLGGSKTPYQFRYGLEDSETYGASNNNPFTMGQTVQISAWIEPQPISIPDLNINMVEIPTIPLQVEPVRLLREETIPLIEPISQLVQSIIMNKDTIVIPAPIFKGIESGTFRVKPQQVIKKFGAIIFDENKAVIGQDGKYELILSMMVSKLKCINCQAEFRLIISGEGINKINIPMIKISSIGKKEAKTLINLKSGSTFKLLQMETCKVIIDDVTLSMKKVK